jgi:hypothetical protein
MARNINEIKDSMTAEFMASDAAQDKYGFAPGAAFGDVFSAVSLENIIFYCVAFCAWVVESLFDTHKQEVLRIIDTLKPHSAAWYVTIAKAFQYSFDLLPDSDKFDNGTHTTDEIETSKIVKYAAVIEFPQKLQMKVAKLSGNDLTGLATDELAAFTTYIQQVKDAGVRLEILTAPADLLKLGLRIYYDALLLKSDGTRIDGEDGNVVETAIKQYLSSIEFDGTVVLAKLVDALQAVEGVKIPHIDLAQFKYGDLPYQNIDVKYQPMAGYMRLDENQTEITYLTIEN